MLWLAKTSLLHHFYMLGISACMCVVSIPLNLLLSVNVSLFLYGSLLVNMLARETNIYMLVSPRAQASYVHVPVQLHQMITFITVKSTLPDEAKKKKTYFSVNSASFQQFSLFQYFSRK